MKSVCFQFHFFTQRKINKLKSTNLHDFRACQMIFSSLFFLGWFTAMHISRTTRYDASSYLFFSVQNYLSFFWDLYDDFSVLFEFRSALSNSTKLQSILVVIFCRISFGSITRSFTSPSYSHESTPDTLREDGMMQIRTRSGRERKNGKDELSEKPNLNFSSFLSYSETRV